MALCVSWWFLVVLGDSVWFLVVSDFFFVGFGLFLVVCGGSL